MSPLIFFRTCWRFACIAFLIFVVMPAVVLCTSYGRMGFYSLRIRQRLYGWGARAVGITTVRQKGTPLLSFDQQTPSQKASGPVVFMSNHISYADILVLGSLFPYTFVSKREVSTWPLLGWATRRYGTVFISREVHDVKEGLKTLWQWLKKGSGIVLFPEGTTSDGCRVLPFKSSYFQLPPHTRIQPISLVYDTVNDMPSTRFFRKIFSWRGDIGLVPHLWKVLGFRKISATVIFHEPFEASHSRKILAEYTWRCVQNGVQTGEPCSCL